MPVHVEARRIFASRLKFWPREDAAAHRVTRMVA